MASRVVMKRGDTLPVVTATLRDTAGPINLHGATVVFVMREHVSGIEIVRGECEIVDEATGVVRYNRLVGDTVQAGRFDGTFVITFSDDAVLTCPSVGVVDVVIE